MQTIDTPIAPLRYAVKFTGDGTARLFLEADLPLPEGPLSTQPVPGDRHQLPALDRMRLFLPELLDELLYPRRT
jgi:hypothetical protein